MASPIEINLSKCTKSALDCPITKQMIIGAEFEDIVTDLEESAEQRRQNFDMFVAACVNNNCPGQNPELTKQIMARNREKRQE